MAKRRNLVGQKFGRLTVVANTGARTTSGEVIWSCRCDCGRFHFASTGNLNHGSVQSCGCLARELAAARMRAAAKPPRICQVPDCEQTTAKGGYGYCGMHAQRLRRHGDPEYVVPEDVKRRNRRDAQIRRFPTVKPTTYRKLFGRHEHRVIAEQLVGRPLRSDEHVHHRDEDKQNNDPENLLVLQAKEHVALHAKLRRRNKC